MASNTKYLTVKRAFRDLDELRALEIGEPFFAYLNQGKKYLLPVLCVRHDPSSYLSLPNKRRSVRVLRVYGERNISLVPNDSPIFRPEALAENFRFGTKEYRELSKMTAQLIADYRARERGEAV